MTYLFAFLLTWGFLALPLNASGETAPYTVERTDGNFELRAYPALTVVETPMASSGGDNSFRRLYGFIRGGNGARQKIAMTAPVLISGENSHRVMAFVMPADVRPERVPKPADATLDVRRLPGGHFAVLRYSGGRNDQMEAQSLLQLETWLKTQKISPQGGPLYGYFDPPWIPTFWRHNEVMLRVASAKSSAP